MAPAAAATPSSKSPTGLRCSSSGTGGRAPDNEPSPPRPRPTVVLLLAAVVAAVVLQGQRGEALSLDYYDERCPEAEAAVTAAVRQAMANDRTVAAGLLRMHFHDCFVRVRIVFTTSISYPSHLFHAASMALAWISFFIRSNSSACNAGLRRVRSLGFDGQRDGGEGRPAQRVAACLLRHRQRQARRRGPLPRRRLLRRYPRARRKSGGPSWVVPVGRRDGRVSLANETTTLPGPTSNFEQLKQAFHGRGLSIKDLVVLSGGHTLGFAHCSSFQNRIHINGQDQAADPALRPSFAASLRRACPANNTVRAAGSALDATSTAFDNAYYRMLQAGRGLLSSDEALLTHPKTRAFVALYAASQETFFRAFAKSMLRMDALNGGDEVRANCRRVNK